MRIFLLFFLTNVGFTPSTFAADQLMVPEKSAWIRATPPGSTTSAMYLTLMNHGDKDIKLVAASSKISDRLELHTHRSEDGVMKMRQVNSITVPAEGIAELIPHGNHVMIFDIAQPLKAGETISVELTFDNDSTLQMDVPVHKQQPDSANSDSATIDHSSHGEHKDKKAKKTHNH